MGAEVHVAVVSALFDRKAEGMCTGRLVRALLDAGLRITLVTSSKSDTRFSHPKLRTLVFPVQPRDPKWLFRAWARATDGLDCNLYCWSRRAARAAFDQRPDFVYARAWPDSSLMAGYRIAEATQLPLWIHLSDPFPPPGDPPLGAARQADLQRVADRARICTFTNAKTVDYQRRFLRFPRADWGRVLPHVSPEPTRLGPRPRAHRFCYVGTFSSRRDPLLMLQAFARYRQQHAQARFAFIGPGHAMLRARVAELGLEAAVEYRPYAPDNRTHMAAADVLVGLDNQHAEPVYSLTKTAEYLAVDRPVLHLVSMESPDYELIQRVGSTARALPPRSADEICDAMLACYAVADEDPGYVQRFEVMRGLGAASIAQQFMALVESVRE